MQAPAPVTEAALQAWVDGRLVGAQRASVEAYLSVHPGDAARLETYRTQLGHLRALYAPVLTETVPERLVRAAQPRPARRLRIATMLASMAVGGALGWQLHATFEARAPAPRAEATFMRHAAIAHATYAPEVRHPVEVGADEEAHLVAWLSKRLGAAVLAPKLGPAGYGLIGGRLLPGESSPVAQFMYESASGARVTLYVRAHARGAPQTALRYAREGNVQVFYWIDRGTNYALSSADLARTALLEIANAVHAQLNP